MDKVTEKPVLVDGKEVTSTLTFVAETTDGTVNLDFILDARALRGKEVVVFEDLFRRRIIGFTQILPTMTKPSKSVIQPLRRKRRIKWRKRDLGLAKSNCA